MVMWWGICTQISTNGTARLRNQKQIRNTLDCGKVGCLNVLTNTRKKSWVNYLLN